MSIEVNATEQIIEVNATGSTIDINVTSQTVDVNAITSVIDVNVTNGPGPGVPDGGLTGQVLKKQSNTDYDTYWAADTVGVPYIGATGNVDLGEYELKAGQLTLDTTPTGTASVGTTRWNDTIGSSETTLKGGSVILKNGVDLVARVVNKVTPNTTLTKAAYQAVRISGAQGQRLAVAFAQANNDNNSADTIGLVTETIATNQEGFIMTVGNLEDINTTGSLQGETWADGDVLYLSPTILGAITNIKPVAPQHLVVIGYVEYAHAVHGKIYVKIMNGWELGELHDVDTTGATSGQVLKYNGTIWTPSSDLDTGITSLNGLTALTQTFATGTSGTDFNISSATSTHTFNLPTASATNRGLVSSSDWSTFNAKIGGTLATGQVAFGSAANTIAGSNNLFWDNTNGRLGIRTNAPSEVLNIRGATDATVSTILFNQQSNNTFTGYLKYTGSNNRIVLGGLFSNVNYEPLSISMNDRLVTFSNNITVSGNNIALGSGNITWVAATGLDFSPFGATSAMRIRQTTGNVLIGGTTDSGQRLQVQGDAFIKGSGNTSGTTALTVQNSSGDNMLSVRNDQFVTIGTLGGTPTLSFGGSVNTVIFRDSGSFALTFRNTFSASTIFNFVTNSNLPNANTSGTNVFMNMGIGFAPTSGTGTWIQMNLTPTINQTGGANGITRGLYVNPTLTAAADWRSIEMSNNSGWGIYQSGASANNYFAGKIVLGTTTVSTFALDVNGTARVQAQLTAQLSSNAGSNPNLLIETSNGDTAVLRIQNSEGNFRLTTNNNAHNITDGTTALSFNSGVVGMRIASGSGGISSDNNMLYVSGSKTASTAAARGIFVDTTLVAAANNDVLVGLDIQPTFTVGAFTGVNSYALRTNGRIYSTNSTLGFSADNAAIGTTGGIYAGSYSTIANELTVNNTNGRFNGSFAAGLSVTMSHNNSSVTTIRTLSVNAPASTATTTALSLMGYIDAGIQAITLGAGSTVTNTFGLRLWPNTIGTNNVHFNIGTTLPTGNWSIYTSSTYANYLNGNTIIGGSAVDGGQKLQVNGDTFIKGSGNTSGSTSLTVQNSDGTNMLRLRNDNNFRLGSTSAGIATGDSVITYAPNGSILHFISPDNYDNTGKIGIGIAIAARASSANTAVNSQVFSITEFGAGYAPTSGSLTRTYFQINATINQTGGANGITRGLFVNPTLTSAADWRAIEAVSASNANHTLLKLRNATVDVFTVKADSKIGFYNATPVAQPTTAIAEAAFVENSGGTAVNVDSTFAGYTLQQIAQALKDLGILA